MWNKTGITKNTGNNMQLDAGVLVTGIDDVSKFNGEVDGVKVKIVSATGADGSFTAVPEVRNLYEGIAGARGQIVDGMVIDNWEIKLTVTLKEMTKETFKMAIGASDITDASALNSSSFDKVTGRNHFKPTDFAKNVCWLGTQKGSDLPIIIEIKNVLNTNGLNFSFADKDSGGLEMELTAHFDSDKPEEVPFAIWIPKVNVPV